MAPPLTIGVYFTWEAHQGCELDHPSIHQTNELLEHVKPADSKHQELYDTGIQQDIQEEPQQEPVMDGIAETRGLQPHE